MIIAVLTTCILSLLGGIHFLWGLGVWFPIRDEAQLTRTVVGAPGVYRMPGPIPCFLVTVGLGLMALTLWLPPSWLVKLVMWLGAIAFLARGALTYTKFWRRVATEEPFATLDKRYYGPLCLFLGAAVIFVCLKGL